MPVALTFWAARMTFEGLTSERDAKNGAGGATIILTFEGIEVANSLISLIHSRDSLIDLLLFQFPATMFLIIFGLYKDAEL